MTSVTVTVTVAVTVVVAAAAAVVTSLSQVPPRMVVTSHRRY